MKLLYIVTLFSFLALTLCSQEQLLNDNSNNEAEFSTVINPLDSNHIVLATLNFNSGFGDCKINIYYTHDFGETWNLSDYHGKVPNQGFSADPVLAFDGEGTLFLVNLAVGSSSHAVYSKSVDGGASWTEEHMNNYDLSDKPWLAIDRWANSPYQGNIYAPLVEGDVKLHVFDATFTLEQVVDTGMGTSHLPSVVVRKDGMVFTSVVNLEPIVGLYVLQWAGGGVDLVHTTLVHDFPEFTLNTYEITPRFQPSVYLAIDNSGGMFDGRLYLSYTAPESVNPTKFDVFVAYSDDDGVTWSSPVAVSGTSQDGIQQFYSSIFVNDQGTLIVDWYDRGNYEENSYMTDFYTAVSTDGGESFQKLLLNSASSDFNIVIPIGSNIGIGEYHQVVATDNMGISFWSDGRNNDGTLQIYMAKYNLHDLTSIQELSVVSNKYTFSSLYPMPSLSSVSLDIRLKKHTEIQYTITDEKGSDIYTAPWKNYTAGDHQLTIDHDLPSGIYFVQLKTIDGYFKTMKWIRQ